jgi:hypothetical protein
MIIFEVVLCVEINRFLSHDPNVSLNKIKFTTQYETCQQERVDNTLEYNYITNEKFIKQALEKYQNILH